jgi:hypothetical protein
MIKGRPAKSSLLPERQGASGIKKRAAFVLTVQLRQGRGQADLSKDDSINPNTQIVSVMRN